MSSNQCTPVTAATQPNPLLAAALEYAQAGWRVLPCKPDGTPYPDWKAPLTAHGLDDATTDAQIILGWWARWPLANVAIATGSPGPDVLDVDVKPDGDGFAALGQLKRAGVLTGALALIRTRSGGLHVYFAGTTQACHALPRHHLDFKASRGYVLAPPSRVGGEQYTLLDHRPGSAGLDWSQVTTILDPPPAVRRGRRPATPPGELPTAVRRALESQVTDRSAALHRLVGACVRAGLDDAAIHELAAGYEPAVAKYGARLHAEVERSLNRIGAR
jgi:hypothetical protein